MKKEEKKKFRFPKGIVTMNFPAMSPIDWELVAQKYISKVTERFTEFPKGAYAVFSYSYPHGIATVSIHRKSTPKRSGISKKGR